MTSPLTIGIDYLQGSARFSTFWEMEAFLLKLEQQMVQGDKYFFEGKGVTIGKEFGNTIRSTKGAWGGFTYKEDYLDCHFQFPGTICREFSNQVKALELVTKATKVSRIDIAVDDYKRRVSQKAIKRLAEKKHYKGLDSFKFIESKPTKGVKTVDTCIFGKSNKIIKFYNAEFMHDIPADRWELLLRRDYAEFCADEIITKQDVRASSKYLAGSLDFVIQKNKNNERDKRYKFWQEFIDELGQCKLRKPRDEPTLDRTLDWLERQVGPTLSVLYFGLGETNFIRAMNQTAERCSERLREHHLAWIDYLQEKGEQIND